MHASAAHIPLTHPCEIKPNRQLKDEVDSALFEYYGTSELVAVDVTGAKPPVTIAPPRLYTEVDARCALDCGLQLRAGSEGLCGAGARAPALCCIRQAPLPC